MKKSTRILALFLAVIACLSMLFCTACNDSGSKDEEETTTTTEPDTGDPGSSETTTAKQDAEDPPVEKVVKKAVIAGGGAGTKIYSAIVELAQKANPRVIILCTAGKDTVSNVAAYVNTFKPYTNDVEAITLCTKLYDPQELHDKILGADIICVGGGQTEFMFDVWKEFKVDEYLTEAYNKGVICCGGSAGGMCWTYAGWNDFITLPESEYKFFYGLDIINVYYGPHFSNSADWKKFDSAIKLISAPKYNTGYAMENGTAIVFIDGVATDTVREKGTEHIYTYTFANGAWTRVEYDY